jgi:sugar phosphate isomerase/epimerase
MGMKIGFSSLVAPSWDLETVVARAAEYGYDGVELRGLKGELHLPLVPALAAKPDAIRSLFGNKKIELVCLASSVTLGSRHRSEIARQKQALIETIELAGRLGCPAVRLFAGEVRRWDTQRAALSRIAKALILLAPAAARHGVTLLVENGGDFPGSQEMWFLIDAVDHPAVRCCWNQAHARLIRERPTNSIPRLGYRVGLVHLCDADFDDQGVLQQYKPIGQGGAEIARQVELLRGIAYDGYLVFEWPKLWVPTLPAPEQVLGATSKYLRERLAEKQPVLTAYKGDKNAPRFAVRAAASTR